jgi:hypothetical protein
VGTPRRGTGPYMYKGLGALRHMRYISTCDLVLYAREPVVEAQRGRRPLHPHQRVGQYCEPGAAGDHRVARRRPRQPRGSQRAREERQGEREWHLWELDFNSLYSMYVDLYIYIY